MNITFVKEVKIYVSEIFQKIDYFFFLIYRSIAVYGCFAAGLTSLIVFAVISWFSGKVDSSDESTNHIALSRGIRITVYLITAVLAVASSVISLIDVDQTIGYNIVPVRIFKNNSFIKSYLIKRRDNKMVVFGKYFLTSNITNIDIEKFPCPLKETYFSV